MDHLLDLLVDAYEKQFNEGLVMALLIDYKLRKSDLEVSQEDLDLLRQQVEKQFDKIPSGEFEIKIDLGDEQLDKRIGKFIETNPITEEDVNAFSKMLMGDYLPSVADSIANKAINSTGKLMVREWNKQAPQALEADKAFFDNLRSRIGVRWGKPLFKLEMLISICKDIGSKFFQSHNALALQNNDKVFEALILLLASGCRIARGILVLLREGLIDDAQARWRTLHEITVIAHFIKPYGNDVAERYLLHVGIENFKLAEAWNKDAASLNRIPVSADDLKELKEERDRLVNRFGAAYENDYGWAAKALNNPKPNFSVDIQGAVKLDQFNTQVKIAHKSIHASSTGIAYQAHSTYPDNPFFEKSTSGVPEPSKQTAITLVLLASTLIMRENTLDGLANMKAILSLRNQVYRAFDKASRTFTLKTRYKR